MRTTLCLAATLSLALVACSEGKAPSDQLKEATEDMVEAASTPDARQAAGPFAPRDECRALPGASAFRDRIESAVERRDADALAALAASDIQLDFGGGAGADELRTRLGDESAGLWNELDALLEMGCAADGQASMTLPWIFAQEIDEVDPMMGMVVTGEGVALRLEPESEADLLEVISWDVVELVDGLRPDASFQHVETTKGKRGYIATESLRSLLDYRLLASSRDGKWSITSLIAGD